MARFLRATKIEFRPVGEVSKYIFKPQLMRRLIDIAGEHAPLKKRKAEYHKLLCKQFYENIKQTRKKGEYCSGVAKILQKKQHP